MLAIGGECVTAIAVGEIARHAADGGDADPGKPVNLAVGQALLQPFDYRPAVGDGLQLCRRAQIAEERASFVDVLEGQHGGEQAALGERLLAGGDVAMLLHG